MDPNVVKAAVAAHEANRVYCQSLGDFSQPAWSDAPDWQKQSAISGVLAILEDPNITPSIQHGNWMKHKLADGWTFGVSKDIDAKTHPCMVPYSELPPEQKVKDELFGAIVRAVLGLSNQ